MPPKLLKKKEKKKRFGRGVQPSQHLALSKFVLNAFRLSFALRFGVLQSLSCQLADPGRILVQHCLPKKRTKCSTTPSTMTGKERQAMN